MGTEEEIERCTESSSYFAEHSLQFVHVADWSSCRCWLRSSWLQHTHTYRHTCTHRQTDRQTGCNVINRICWKPMWRLSYTRRHLKTHYFQQAYSSL